MALYPMPRRDESRLPGADLDPEVYTVSRLTQAVKAALREAFPRTVWIAAEIHGMRPWGARGGEVKGIFLSLAEKEEAKDEPKAVVGAVIWKRELAGIEQKLRRVDPKLALADGLQVKVRVRVDFWKNRGEFKLAVLDVDPHFTLGALAANRARLLERLRREGLLERNRRLPLPLVPLQVGLITAGASAAFNDFRKTLVDSGFGFRVRLCNSRMQGDETETQVCQGLRVLAADPRVALIVIARGGGSRTDLMYFDSEKLARAIAACSKPVLTGIGHEIDRSIADEVAGAAFKTPTAVAQYLADRVREFLEGAETSFAGLLRLAKGQLRECRRETEETARRLAREARERLARQRRELAMLGGSIVRAVHRERRRVRTELLRTARSLNVAVRTLLRSDRSRVRHCRQRLRPERFRALLQARRRELLKGATLLRDRAGRLLERERERLGQLDARARAADPQRILERGFSITSDEAGRTVHSVDDLQLGARARIRLRDGRLHTEVIDKEKQDGAEKEARDRPGT